MKSDTKKLVMTAMLCAIAYVLMHLVHLRLIPAAPFLTYDPKDCIIVIGGFLFGPFYAVLISVIVAFFEMIFVSDTGIIGLIMQVLATAAYAGTAAAIYQHNRTKKTAAISLGCGSAAMVAAMIVLNYLLSPIYLGTGRDVVLKLMIPAIIPFNAVKAIINSVLAFIIYKPLVRALRKTGLVDIR